MELQQVFALKLKSLLGTIALRLFPQRAQRLAGRIGADDVRLIDRIILFGLKRNVGEPAQLSRLHSRFWAGPAGVRFSERCAERFGAWFMAAHHGVVDEVEKMIASDPRRYVFLYEIGCGDGQVVHYLSQRLRTIQRFTGIDINAEVIARNKQTYTQSNLDFACGNAIDWISRHAHPGSIFISNGGVLEYFSEKDMTVLLQHIRRCLRPAAFAIIEPIADDHDLERETASRPFGREWSFSHNHKRLFEENGFHILYQRETATGGNRWVLLLARTQDHDNG